MPKTVEIVLTPKEAADSASYTAAAMKAAGVSSPDEVAFCRVVRRSIDARRHTSGIRGVRVNMAVELWLDREGRPDPVHFEWGDVSNVPASRQVVIVGAGPAGLFAALELIERGFRPVILERGKDVSKRKADIAAIQRNEPVNPDSNYAFGEGGAGTYSDGKLYTRSKNAGISGNRWKFSISTGRTNPSFTMRIHISAPTACRASSPRSGKPSGRREALSGSTAA